MIDKITPMRASMIEEILGADYSTHNILHDGLGVEDAVNILSKCHDDIVISLSKTGRNLGIPT